LGFFLVLQTSILPAARKRKRQNGRAGPHILPRGMRYRRIAISDASTQDVAKETSLAFRPMMR
jgi:hypothetical protein